MMSYPNKPYINGGRAYLSSFRMLYKSSISITIMAGFVVQGPNRDERVRSALLCSDG